jgi:hypothetical protein
MLRACVIHFDKSWDKCLALAEFAYNNSYQASLKMAPFETLYGRRCHTPLNWSQVGERTLFGSKLVQEAEEKVNVIREHLRAAQMRQKSYHAVVSVGHDGEVELPLRAYKTPPSFSLMCPSNRAVRRSPPLAPPTALLLCLLPC